VLDVNKKGIEGAAVTIAIACASSIHVNKKVYHDFTLDKNFGYILTDSNDVVLFEGQVTE
jgi:serine protease inhibitor